MRFCVNRDTLWKWPAFVPPEFSPGFSGYSLFREWLHTFSDTRSLSGRSLKLYRLKHHKGRSEVGFGGGPYDPTGEMRPSAHTLDVYHFANYPQ